MEKGAWHVQGCVGRRGRETLKGAELCAWKEGVGEARRARLAPGPPAQLTVTLTIMPPLLQCCPTWQAYLREWQGRRARASVQRSRGSRQQLANVHPAPAGHPTAAPSCVHSECPVARPLTSRCRARQRSRRPRRSQRGAPPRRTGAATRQSSAGGEQRGWGGGGDGRCAHAELMQREATAAKLRQGRGRCMLLLLAGAQHAPWGRCRRGCGTRRAACCRPT